MNWRIVILLASGVVAWAQLPPPQAPAPPIEASEREGRHAPSPAPGETALVDAVVYDAKGQTVPGLKAGDFSLSVNGASKAIESCEYRASDPLRLAVILDDLSLSFEHNNAARRDLRAFFERLGTNTEVAILKSSAGSGAVDRFSSDRRAWTEALNRAPYNPAAEGAAPETLAGAFRIALRGALEGLRELPGRKAVLVISERLREPARSTQISATGVAAIAHAASAVIYVVDMSGGSELTALDLGLPGLVKDTGGVYFNATPVAAALTQIARDDAGFYVLGYRAEHAGFLPSSRVERLSVSAGSGRTVRARNGSFPVAPDVTQAAERDLNANRAVGRELVAGEVGTRVAALATSNGAWQVHGLVHVDGSDMTLVRGADGKYHGEVDLITVLRPDSGGPEERLARTVDLTMSEKGREESLDWGFSYTATMPIAKPGSYHLLVIARDDASGRIGSARASVTADWGANKLSMTSMMVHGEMVTTATGETVGVPQEAADIRLFRAGRKLKYEYDLWNVASDGEKRSLVEVRARIWRDGALVVDGAPTPIQFDASATPAHRGASGTITLKAQTAPGKYILGITVLDKLSGRSATRYTDFEVRP